MIVSAPRRQPRMATAAVELAVCLPFFMVLLLGTWEAGRLAEVNAIANNACREGARQASIGAKVNLTDGTEDEITVSEVQDTVRIYLARNNITVVNGDVSFTNLTDSTRNTPKTSIKNDLLQVQVLVPLAQWKWSGTVTAVTGVTGNLRCSSVWPSARDSVIGTPSTSFPLQ